MALRVSRAEYLKLEVVTYQLQEQHYDGSQELL